VHYTQNPTAKDYFAYQVPAGTTTSFVDHVSIITGPGSSVVIEKGLETISVPEKSIFELSPKWKECVMETDAYGKPTGQWREKSFFDSVLGTINGFFGSIQEKAFEIIQPTTVAGVRG
jgi:hypothetical protein